MSCFEGSEDWKNDNNTLQVKPKPETSNAENNDNNAKDLEEEGGRVDKGSDAGAEKLVLPLDQPEERITKKTFGMYITPQNSPIENERFRGYHTGADWEAFPAEIGREVSIRSICGGVLLEKKYVSGYGGAAIERCSLGEEKITVLYGHLDLESISVKEGDMLKKGEKIGNLGAHKSEETDGERKHLHLGIHRGGGIDYRGYVDSANELKDWIDPCIYFCPGLEI